MNVSLGNRRTLELLKDLRRRITREHTHGRFVGGMCHYLGDVTKNNKERNLLLTYLNHIRPLPLWYNRVRSGYKSAYWWKPDEYKPRKKWLDKKIKRLERLIELTTDGI